MQVVRENCVRSRLRNIRVLIPMVFMVGSVNAQHVYTWDDIRRGFEQSNPTLKAARANVEESRAQEITAYLRPNPDFSFLTDGTQVTTANGVWRPFSGTLFQTGLSYLHERDHKRELRLQTAREGTAIAESTYADQARTLLFNLRNAFVQALQAKAILQNAKENLSYWDHELDIDRERYSAGDLSQVDLDRLELQRIQFQSDLEIAIVNVRTNKIQLLQLLNERIPIDEFDVMGPFDFHPELISLQDFRDIAMVARPDLQAAKQTVAQANINYKLAVANGSTDPTFSGWWTHNGSWNNPFAADTVGASVSIPLRIFDRNQGEKARTQIDIRRSERLRDATEATVLSDVDSAYWTLVQALNLLKPYKDRYLKLAGDVRDRMTFSYKNGGASLLDLLDAEKSYRDTRLAYLNLVGSYLTAAAQMNMAVGREILR